MRSKCRQPQQGVALEHLEDPQLLELGVRRLAWRAPLALGVGDLEQPVSVEQLAIGAGEKAAIIGPSGCGKTTLLSAISGILVPTSGSVIVGDTEVSKLGEKERRAFRCDRIGLVFQEFELLEHLDIRENAFLPRWLAGREASKEDQHSKSSFRMEGLTN